MIRVRTGSGGFQNAWILLKFVLTMALFLDKTNSAFSAFIIKHVSANQFRHTSTAMLEHHLNKMAANLPKKNDAFLLLAKLRCIPNRSPITALK